MLKILDYGIIALRTFSVLYSHSRSLQPKLHDKFSIAIILCNSSAKKNAQASDIGFILVGTFKKLNN